jgi:hypothetical protein
MSDELIEELVQRLDQQHADMLRQTLAMQQLSKAILQLSANVMQLDSTMATRR